LLLAMSGTWHAHTEAQRTICRFLDAEGVMHGFGVAHHEAAVRQALLAALGTAVNSAVEKSVA
jgi:rubredoxin-NAD+ reductase